MPARDRITVDLRGLSETVKAHAAAHHLTLAAFARSALVASVREPPRHDKRAELRVALTGSRTVKITLRVAEPIADAFRLRAIEAGVPYSECLMGLLQDATTPHTARDRANELAALATSNDRLATMSTDMKDFVRLMRVADSPEVNTCRDRMATLIDDLRQHLDVASDLMTALRPAARPLRQVALASRVRRLRQTSR